MANILNVILLSPVLIFVVLLLVNNNLLGIKGEVNLFITAFEVPIVAFMAVFFVGYIIIMYCLFKFSNFFVSHKNKNLTGEVNSLKAEMLDREPKLIKAIENKFSEILAKSDDSHNKTIDILKKENEKVVTNLTYDLKIIKEKVEKLKVSEK